MNSQKQNRQLDVFTRGFITVLMVVGFSLDGCQSNDGLFIVATLMWIYQPFVVRAETFILQHLHRVGDLPQKWGDTHD